MSLAWAGSNLWLHLRASIVISSRGKCSGQCPAGVLGATTERMLLGATIERMLERPRDCSGRRPRVLAGRRLLAATIEKVLGVTSKGVLAATSE